MKRARRPAELCLIQPQASGIISLMYAFLARRFCFLGLVVLLAQLSGSYSAGQSAPPAEQPLVILTTSVPKAYLKQAYLTTLEKRSGTSPVKWDVTDGSLPPGIMLDPDGLLRGTPSAAGEFHFTVTAKDTSRPGAEKQAQLVLWVVNPLLAQWRRYPKVTGEKLEGSIEVANQGDQDADVTVIVLAVDVSSQRATAIGYQHLELKKNSDSLEIPFGDNLPFGTYQLNADVVAEEPGINSIYRQRLVPKEKFEIRQQP